MPVDSSACLVSGEVALGSDVVVEMEGWAMLGCGRCAVMVT